MESMGALLAAASGLSGSPIPVSGETGQKASAASFGHALSTAPRLKRDGLLQQMVERGILIAELRLAKISHRSTSDLGAKLRRLTNEILTTEAT